jgi:hypothetical protein
VATVDLTASRTDRSVFPVLIRRRGEPASVIGTAFCITVLLNGEVVCATAKHVVEQLEATDGLEPFVGLPQLVPEGQDRQLVGLPVRQICIAGTHSDVALLVANRTESPLPVGEVLAFNLTMDPPVVGSGCMALGYPQKQGVASGQLIASRGLVEEIHPAKRDSVLSDFPTFRTTAAYRSGMSGGPIIDSRGYVAGVVSHGFDEESGPPLGYGAAIAGLVELKVELHDDNRVLREFTFPELIAHKAVGTISDRSVTLQRSEEGVMLTWHQDGDTSSEQPQPAG